MSRWIIDGHLIEDKITGKFYQSKDKFIVDAFNVLYDEIQKLKKE